MTGTRRPLGVFVLLCALAAACGNATEGKFGEELYRTACAGCHANDGGGGRGPAIGTPDANAATVLTDEQIRGVIRVGPGAMPAWSRLTDAQVDSLVVYLRQLQGGE
jgi:mono/diheme cytochrome c family protein